MARLLLKVSCHFPFVCSLEHFHGEEVAFRPDRASGWFGFVAKENITRNLTESGPGVNDLLAGREDIDGRDLTADVTGKAPKVIPPLLFHYPHVWGPRGPGYEPHSSIRVGDWKAIYFYQPQRWELYNLKDDIGEAKNLASTYPERLKDLSGRMKIEHDRRGAQYPANRETKEPEPPVWR